jgi:hypothetical protein
MLPAPSIVCRVVRPIMAPIVARPNSLLLVWPGHAHTLTVASSCGTVQRTAYCPEGVLYGALLNLFLDAAIRPLTEADERALLGVAA